MPSFSDMIRAVRIRWNLWRFKPTLSDRQKEAIRHNAKQRL